MLRWMSEQRIREDELFMAEKVTRHAAVLTFLPAADHVLEKVDRDRLVSGQVGLHVPGEEVVALPLAVVLGLEGLYVDAHLVLRLHHHRVVGCHALLEIK